MKKERIPLKQENNRVPIEMDESLTLKIDIHPPARNFTCTEISIPFPKDQSKISSVKCINKTLNKCSSLGLALTEVKHFNFMQVLLKFLFLL